MPRLIFHIGHAKTATTYLQHAIHLNAHKFLDAGYFVPADFSRIDGYNLRNLAQKSITFSGNAGQLFFDIQKGRSRFLDAIAKDAEGQNIILSTELIFYYPEVLSKITNFFKNSGYDVHVIVYLARYEKSVISGYIQNVRNHFYSGGVCDFIYRTRNLRYFSFASVLAEIIEKCSPDAMDIRTFAPVFLVGSDIFSDFLDCAGVDLGPMSELTMPSNKVNESLCLEVLELLRVLNRSAPQDVIEACRALNPPLAEVERTKIFDYYYVPEVRWAIMDRFQDDRRTFIATFLKDRSQEERDYWLQLPVASESTQLDVERFARLVEQLL